MEIVYYFCLPVSILIIIAKLIDNRHNRHIKRINATRDNDPDTNKLVMGIVDNMKAHPLDWYASWPYMTNESLDINVDTVDGRIQHKSAVIYVSEKQHGLMDDAYRTHVGPVLEMKRAEQTKEDKQKLIEVLTGE